MLKNYLKVALRTLRKQRLYGTINVAGLGIGLAGCLLMGLYVWGELAVDGFHAKADRIVRVVQDTPSGSTAKTGGAHAALLEASAAGVEATARLVPWERTISVGDPSAGAGQPLGSKSRGPFDEPQFAYADPSFFEVFSFRLASGDPATALAEPGTAVLTEATAEKYFGDADPIGRTVWMYDEYSDPDQIPLVVTGVLADAPGRSHLTLSVLSSTLTMERQYGPLSQLGWPGLYTYAVLADGTDRAETAAQTTTALVERLEADASEAPALRLQPLADIYLHPQERGEAGVGGSRTLVYGLAGIALIVLLLACANFTNLALVRAVARMKDVGVRKAMGAQRSQLAAQSLTDSLLLAGGGLLVALGLVVTVRPYLDTVVGHPLDVAAPGGLVALALVGIVVLTGLVAGGYPALFLAGQQPAEAIRGRTGGGFGAARLRSGLVVFQFGTSVALVIVALVIYQQLDHVRSLDLGFDQERIVTISADGARRSFEPLREALSAQPGVLAVSGVNGTPGLQEVRTGLVVRRESRHDVPVSTQAAAPGFFEMMDIGATAGRLPAWEAQETASDRALVLNETAATALGLGEAAVGQAVRIVEPGNEANNPGLTGTVAAVVPDFHHGSLRTRIPAAVYFSARSVDVAELYVVSDVLVKLAPGATADQLQRLETAWQSVLPNHPFEATFLDARIQAQYERDLRLGRAVGLFAGFAVFIACLGLLGLAAFAAEQRTKEIGIRKALGATAGSIVRLLSTDFAKLMLTGAVAAAPVAWWVASRWLDGFAYRIGLGPGLFLVAGGLALVVALATVGVQALRAATADPVRALRYE
ncbi:MAG: ABC transporter permease [Bacteroidota bacterium]